MAYKILDHGFWRPYTPDPLPEWAQQASALGGTVLFMRRESDNVDWYDFIKTDGQFFENAVLALTVPDADPATETVGAISRDETKLVPYNQRVIEILGVDPAEPKPHNLFEWLTYHPDTKTFSGEPGPPKAPEVDLSVSAAQALIQLSRMPHDGSVVPGTDNLLDATEALVDASKDRELKTWFNRAQRWIITNPNVQKIGVAFNMSQDDIKAAFDAASKIEE